MKLSLIHLYPHYNSIRNHLMNQLREQTYCQSNNSVWTQVRDHTCYTAGDITLTPIFSQIWLTVARNT